MAKPSLGDQELALLRFIAEQGPVSVGEAAERYGEGQGLARSTILTVMERLRKKKYLRRQVERDGLYRYQSTAPPRELLRGVVSSFVDRTLAGDLSPFVAFLAESSELSESEVKQLEKLAARLETRKKENDRG